MSEAIKLNATLRSDKGKGASRRLRHKEQVPAIVYGGDIAPVSIVIESRVVKRALENEAFYSQIINLEIDKKHQDVILKDVQRHPARGDAMHLDFLRVSASQEINTSIPLHFVNEDTCAGVKAGGVLSHTVNEVEVRCLPAALPGFIEIDVASLEIGQTIHLTDLKLPEGVQLVQLLQGESHDLAVVTVKAPKKGGDETETVAGTEEGEEETTENKE